MKEKIILIPIIFLLLISPQIRSQVNVQKYLTGTKITSIKSFGKYIWVSTYGEGIYRYSIQSKKWKNYSTNNNNLRNDFYYALAVSKRYVWAGSSEGLYIFDKKRKKWRKRKFSKGGELGNWIRSLNFDKQLNSLWIGRFKYLTIYNLKRRRYKDIDLTVNKNLKTNNFKTIKIDGDSLVWFGTEAGIHIYNKKYKIDNKNGWKYIGNNGNNFNGDGEAVSISDILFNNKNVWIATDQFVTAKKPLFNVGGIYIYDRNFTWKRISKKDGLNDNGISSLAKTGNKIWAGNYSFFERDKKELGRGLYMFDNFFPQVNRIIFNNFDMNSTMVKTMYFDGSLLWIGTDKGLLVLNLDNPLAHLKKGTN